MMSEVGTVQLTEGQLKAERYVASNRFRLQANKGPVFEKRWAERKSRLANLDGFRFFTLMRRVEGSPGGPPSPPSPSGPGPPIPSRSSPARRSRASAPA